MKMGMEIRRKAMRGLLKEGGPVPIKKKAEMGMSSEEDKAAPGEGELTSMMVTAEEKAMIEKMRAGASEQAEGESEDDEAEMG